MSIKDKLDCIANKVKEIKKDIDGAPEIGAVYDLMVSLEPLEEEYIDWCYQNDSDHGLEKGTTYRDGDIMEFYIESWDYHQVSLALRELRKLINGE